MPYVGQLSAATASFTPAASSHAIGDVYGGAQEFKGMAQSTGAGVQILSASMRVDGGTLETATWRLYLYNVTPPSAIADDGIFDLASGDRSAFIGYVDIAQLVDLGSTLYVQSDNLNKGIKLGGRSAFGYLVSLTGVLTPQAVAHVVTLHTVG